MFAFMILALGACVVSIMAGLSGPWTASISRPEPEAKLSREPVKPQLPPEVMAVLSRNALRDGRGDPLDQDAQKHMEIAGGRLICLSENPAAIIKGARKSK
jgi:hypothetical protein